MASVEEKKTILLVEEDEEQVTFAMRALRKHGIDGPYVGDWQNRR